MLVVVLLGVWRRSFRICNLLVEVLDSLELVVVEVSVSVSVLVLLAEVLDVSELVSVLVMVDESEVELDAVPVYWNWTL